MNKEKKRIETSSKSNKKFVYEKEIKEFLKLYKELPTTVHNKKQNIKKDGYKDIIKI